MKNLTKEQEARRDQYFAQAIKSGELTKEDISRIMSDPIKSNAINTIISLSK